MYQWWRKEELNLYICFGYIIFLSLLTASELCSSKAPKDVMKIETDAVFLLHVSLSSWSLIFLLFLPYCSVFIWYWWNTGFTLVQPDFDPPNAWSESFVGAGSKSQCDVNQPIVWLNYDLIAFWASSRKLSCLQTSSNFYVSPIVLQCTNGLV